MKAMATVRNVRRNGSGYLQFYLRLPEEPATIRAWIGSGKASVTRSLGTHDPIEAQPLADRWTREIEADIAAIIAGTYQKPDDRAAEQLAREWLREMVVVHQFDPDEIDGGVTAWMAVKEISPSIRGLVLDHCKRLHTEQRDVWDGRAARNMTEHLGGLESDTPAVIAPHSVERPKTREIDYTGLEYENACKPITDDLIDRFLEGKGYRKDGTDHKTGLSYRKTIGRLNSIVGQKPIAGIDTLDIEKLYQLLLTTKSDKGKGTLSVSTVYRSISETRQFFKWCVARHLIEDDPCRKIIVESSDHEESDEEKREPFRHNMEDALRDATTSDEARKRLMGRFREGTGKLYGGRDLMPKESKVFDKVKLNVDLQHLY
jgi:hypothetical protein